MSDFRRMVRFTITHGIPASGKTTWAKQRVAEEEKTMRVERDIVRAIIQFEKDGVDTTIMQELDRPNYERWNFKWEKQVTERYWDWIKNILDNSPNIDHIILSDTNLNFDRNVAMVKKLRMLCADRNILPVVEHKIFHVSYEEALERDTRRTGSVGQKVIYKFWRDYINILRDFDPAPETVIGEIDHDRDHISFVLDAIWNGDRTLTHKNAVIVDVDGTVATMYDDLGVRMRSPFEWDKVQHDRAKTDIMQMVKAFAIHHDADILFVTGRDGACHEETRAWLNFWFGENQYHGFYGRAEGDSRKDTVVKAEILVNHIKPMYNVVGVFDDRPSVCRMWRDFGLNVIQVGDPYKEF